MYIGIEVLKMGIRLGKAGVMGLGAWSFFLFMYNLPVQDAARGYLGIWSHWQGVGKQDFKLGVLGLGGTTIIHSAIIRGME